MVDKKLRISDNIRFIREKLGYSQEYVANKLDVSQQAYSHIEKNPEKATLIRLKEIAEILKINLATLINEDDTYVQQNFNQQGGNAASQIHLSTNADTYEKLITKL